MGDVAMLFWSQDLHSQSLEPTPNMIDTNLPFFCKNLSLEQLKSESSVENHLTSYRLVSKFLVAAQPLFPIIPS